MDVPPPPRPGSTAGLSPPPAAAAGAARAVRHVVMLGLMGSGKTTVGSLVAARLGVALRDSDAGIEARLGRTVRQLAAERGDDAMHAIEAGQLLLDLAGDAPSVICAAASVVDDDGCIAALRDPSLLLAWLRVSPTVAARRFEERAHRPRFGEDTRAFLERQAATREPRLASLGALELSTDDADPADVAERIVAAWFRRSSAA